MGLSPEDGRGERRADDRSQRHAVRRCRGGRGLGLVPVPLWLTNDQPTELDKEVPICARPPTRALPRTSWFANMDCSAGVAASRPPAHELVATSNLLTRSPARPARPRRGRDADGSPRRWTGFSPVLAPAP